MSFGWTWPDFNFIFRRFNCLALTCVCWPDEKGFGFLGSLNLVHCSWSKATTCYPTACPPLAFPQSIWHQIYQLIRHPPLASPAVMASALEKLWSTFGVSNCMDVLSGNHYIANYHYRKRSLLEIDCVWIIASRCVTVVTTCDSNKMEEVSKFPVPSLKRWKHNKVSRMSGCI